MGDPHNGYGWFKIVKMENHVKMDDDWGYPYDETETSK